MMNKGEVGFSHIVAALIALLVFVTLVLIFNKQLGELLKPVTEAIKSIAGFGGQIGK